MISSEQLKSAQDLARVKYPQAHSLHLEYLGCSDSSCSTHACYAASILSTEQEVLEVAFSEGAVDQISDLQALQNLVAKLSRK